MSGIRHIVSLLAVVVLAGCAGSSGTMDDDAYGDEAGAAGGSPSSTTSDSSGDGLRGGSEFGESMDGEAFILENRVIYFDLDKSEVSAEYLEVIEAHGAYLSTNPGARVRLEGHGDERGSREYNIGLGEGRSQAVRQMLLLQGVTAVQISTVSYGEERPAVLGSDEEAWSLNRRVELVYLQ
jgi:peptidoglycan-associated lipoprotein